MQYGFLFWVGVGLFAILVGVFAIPLAMGIGIALLTALPVVLAVVALISCISSNKPTNTKLLWIIVIVLAPFLGALLWFLWGKYQP